MNIEIYKGIPFSDIIPDNIKTSGTKIIKETFKGKFLRNEFLFESPVNGIKYYFDYFYNPIFDDNGLVKYVSISAVDITDIKNTQTALEESEKRYRGIVNLQSNLLFRVDTEGRFTFANDAYCKKFGKKINELIGSKFMPLVHPDDQLLTLKEIENLERPPYLIKLEQRALTADGWRWIQWEDVTIKNEKGVTVEIQGAGRDITELKESITSLSETNELLNTILSSSPLGIVVIDQEGKIKFWSMGAERIFQWKANDVIGKFNPIVTKDNFESYNKKCIRLFKGDSLNESHLERNRKDGSTILLEVFGAPLKDSKGKIKEGLLIYQDITSKVQTEFENIKLSSVLNSSTSAIAILNENLMFESINSRYNRLTEYELRDVKGKNLRDFKPPQMTTNEYEDIVATIESGKEWSGQTINVTKGGNLYWENILISPVNNLKGKIGNYILFREDISENKKALQELVNSRLRLGTILNNFSNIVLYEFGGKSPFISSNVLNILGYSSDTILEKENFLESIIIQEDINEYLNAFNKWNTGNTEDTFKINYRCITADGSIIWVENIMSKVYEGDKYYFCGVLQDITDFKNKEDIIAWNETLLRIMTDSTRYGYYVANKKTDSVLYINEKFCELWNIKDYYEKILQRQIKSSEVLRMCSFNVENPDNFIQTASRYGNPENQITFEDEINFLNGRTIRRFSSLLEDNKGNYLGRFYLYEDITEKKFFEMMQKSRTDYNVVIEQALDGTLLFDSKGTIKGANQIICSLLGYSKNDLTRHNIVDIFDTSDPNNEEPKFLDALDGKTIIAKRRLVKSNGTLLYAEMHTKMLPNRLIQSVIWEIGKMNYEKNSGLFANIINPYFHLLIKLKVFKHGESSLTCLNRISLFMKNYHYFFDTYSAVNSYDKEISERFITLISEFEHSVYPQLEYIISILSRLNLDFPKASMYDEVINAINDMNLYTKSLNKNLEILKNFMNRKDNPVKVSDVVGIVLESIVKIKSKIRIINNSFDENFTSDLESTLHNLIKNYSNSYPWLRISYKDFSANTRVVFNKGELVDFMRIFFDNSIESYENSEDDKPLKKIDIIINQDKENLVLEFLDYGDGVPDSIKSSLMLKGVSTKGAGRGFGLNYANTVVQKYGGRFYLDSDFKSGAKFNIILNTI
jgi:PAS domain S-box-containing protein